ncbi:hypothetical protein KEM56_004999 [Ascosphaera pollenicola]|nr:hypothetical protein KEM56_004999 [Ascosphaera pollenicola]
MRLTTELIQSSLSYISPLKERELDLRAIENLGVAGPSLAKSIPGLATLVLTQNNIAELADLEPLRYLSRLTHLSILENPVTRKEHYRLWVIWLVPSVRFLDYQKVRDAERGRAAELFGTIEEPTDLAKNTLGVKSRVFDPSAIESGRGAGPAERAIRVKLTPKERKRAEKLIREAKDLQTIARLEKELNEGRVPGGTVGYEDDESDGDNDTKMA